MTFIDNISVYDFTTDALKFLVHFLGDIHQPFHVSFSDNSGANYIKIQFMNRTTNMHSLWDTDMISIGKKIMEVALKKTQYTKMNVMGGENFLNI